VNNDPLLYLILEKQSGRVFILDIKTQFFTIKVLGIDDNEGLGPCRKLICGISDIPCERFRYRKLGDVVD
jgi:hypothetical protein